MDNAKLGKVRSDTQDGLYSVWEKVQHKMNRVQFEKGHCWVKFGRRGLGGPAGLSLLFPFEDTSTSTMSQIHGFFRLDHMADSNTGPACRSRLVSPGEMGLCGSWPPVGRTDGAWTFLVEPGVGGR